MQLFVPKCFIRVRYKIGLKCRDGENRTFHLYWPNYHFVYLWHMGGHWDTFFLGGGGEPQGYKENMQSQCSTGSGLNLGSVTVRQWFCYLCHWHMRHFSTANGSLYKVLAQHCLVNKESGNG